jgi:hypothetical protein
MSYLNERIGKKYLDIKAKRIILTSKHFSGMENSMLDPREVHTKNTPPSVSSELPLNFDLDDMNPFDELWDDGLAKDDSHIDREGDVPCWRRIEMLLEDKQLRTSLAEFEDYDDFEYFDHNRTADYST